jgi:hypothetical protein
MFIKRAPGDILDIKADARNRNTARRAMHSYEIRSSECIPTQDCVIGIAFRHGLCNYRLLDPRAVGSVCAGRPLPFGRDEARRMQGNSYRLKTPTLGIISETTGEPGRPNSETLSRIDSKDLWI